MSELSHEAIRERLLGDVAVDETTGCWVFAKVGGHGYGRVSIGGRRRAAHRVSYEVFVGPIPAGLQIDHLCRNRACCNPEHLEPVTGAENVRRGICGDINRARMLARTHCANGHEYTPDNTRQTKRQRQCRQCARDIAKRYASAHPERVRVVEMRRLQPCLGCGGPKPLGRGLRYCASCRPFPEVEL